MVGPEVVEAVAASFESTEGTGMPLGERMILALEAGQAKGEIDAGATCNQRPSRWRPEHSRTRRRQHRAGHRGRRAPRTRRRDEANLRHLTCARLPQLFRIDGPDVVELKRMLHALGYWRPTLTTFPNAPSGTSNQKLAELRKTDPAAADKLQAESRRIQQEYTGVRAVRRRKPRRPSTSSAPTKGSTTRAVPRVSSISAWSTRCARRTSPSESRAEVKKAGELCEF